MAEGYFYSFGGYFWSSVFLGLTTMGAGFWLAYRARSEGGILVGAALALLGWVFTALTGTWVHMIAAGVG